MISDFLQENKNYFPKLEEFANNVFEKVQKNNRTRYIALCEYLNSEYNIHVKDVIPDQDKLFSKIFNKNKKELLLSDYSSLETKKLHAAAQIFAGSGGGGNYRHKFFEENLGLRKKT